MHEPDVYPIAVSALIVDPAVQRGIDKRRVHKIADGIDLDAIGVITVSIRDNGDHHIIDGQHRVEALRAAGFGQGCVTCRVFKSLSLAQEAAMFRLLNASAKVGFLDQFRVRVIEGDPVAVDISRIAERYGWTISPSGRAKSGFFAVAAMERIYLQDKVAAERAMATATRAWGHDSLGVDGRIIEGLGLVYARYGDAAEINELTERLSKFGGGPGALLGKARGLRDLIGSTVTKSVAEIVVEIYNQRRRTRPLPSWRSA